MTPIQIFVVLVILLPIILVVANRLRMDLAALLIAVLLGVAQFAGYAVLGPARTPADAVNAISGFGQPVVLTLLSLFILTRGLEKSGVTRWIARRILELGGASETRLIALFAGATGLLSLFMNNLAAGALLLPAAMEASRRSGIRPSKLLIPVAYGSLLGGAATYFTTANIIVSNLLAIAQPPQKPLSVLDFTPVGGLIALVGIGFLAWLGKRLLPDRVPPADQAFARMTGSELEALYQLGERLWEGEVRPDSPLVGSTLDQTGIGETLGIAVAAIWTGDQAVFSPSPLRVIRAGDVLLLVGREERVCQLEGRGMTIARESVEGPLSTRGATVVEVMLAPHAKIEGYTLKELDFRQKYGFTAVALRRKERSFRTDVGTLRLSFGDSLLMVGARSRLAALQRDPDFIVFVPNSGDQPVDRRLAAITVGVTLAAVAVSILGVPVYLAMLGGAIAVMLAGVLTAEESYRSVEWQAIFLIAGMYAASLAMVQTGLANLLGKLMIGLVAPLGPLGLAGGAFLLTALLTQVMGGQVTALVTGPVAISAAIAMGTSPQAIAVATAIGCSASFLTPIAHPVNVLMIAPANYKFGDFFRVGWPLTILSFLALLAGMALFWRL